MDQPFDLAVVGAGPAGYVAALRASQLGMRVALIDQRANLGGTCLHLGCIPSKTWLHSSQIYQVMVEPPLFELHSKGGAFDFEAMHARRANVIEQLGCGILALCKRQGITFMQGSARVLDAETIECSAPDGSRTRLACRRILLATGSKPVELPDLPFDEQQVLSSSGALYLRKLPSSMIVVGAGAVGLELASLYLRLGCEVTVVEMASQIAPSMDFIVADRLQKSLVKQGIRFILEAKIQDVKLAQSVEIEVSSAAAPQQRVSAEKILVAVGRRPNMEGLGVQDLGIACDSRGGIAVNGEFQSSIPSIYAVGDLIEGPMLAHKSSKEAQVAVERMAGIQSQIHYMSVASVIYTDPEVASVGLSRKEAESTGRAFLLGYVAMKHNARAKSHGQEEGFVQLVADQKTHRLLGMQIVGGPAGELIALGSLALSMKMTLEDLLQSSWAHPTFSESIQEAALQALGRPLHS